MPRYDPWTKKRHGFPRTDSPAFQREWKSLGSSGVLLDDTASQIVVKAASGPSESGVSGTLYLWGLGMCTTNSAAAGGHIKDDAGNTLATVVSTRNGPFFLQLPTPIKLPQNSNLVYHQIIYRAESYLTPFYLSLIHI